MPSNINLINFRRKKDDFIVEKSSNHKAMDDILLEYHLNFIESLKDCTF